MFWHFLNSIPPDTILGESYVHVPQTSVDADLTAFPLMVRLQDLPASVKDNLTDDAGNLRAYDDAGNPIALDVVSYNPVQKVGRAFVRTDLVTASATMVQLTAERGATMPAADSTYGQEAVWADFVSVLAGDSTKNRVDDSSAGGGPPVTFMRGWKKAEETGTSDSGRGLAVNSSYLYTGRNNLLRRRDPVTFASGATNTDPVSDVTNSDVTLVWSMFATETTLYVAFFDDSTGQDGCIAEFDPVTLAYSSETDLSHRAMAMAFDGTHWWIVDFFDDNNLYQYDETFTLVSTISLSTAIDDMTGIAYIPEYPDYVFINNNAGRVRPVKKSDGTVRPIALHFFDGDSERNIAWDEDRQRLLGVAFSNGDLHEYKKDDPTRYDWMQIRNQDFTHSIAQRVQTFTMVGSFWQETNGTDGLMEYGQEVAVYHDDPPGEASLRHVPEFDDRRTGVNFPTGDEGYARIAARLDGGNQDLWQDGVERYTGTGQTAQPTGTSASTMLWGGGSGVELLGEIGYSWLREEAMSDAWLKADYENYNLPTDFYLATPTADAWDHGQSVLLEGGAEWAGLAWDLTDVQANTSMTVGPFASPRTGSYLFSTGNVASGSMRQRVQVPAENVGQDFSLYFDYWCRGDGNDQVQMEIDLLDAGGNVIATRTGDEIIPINVWTKATEVFEGDASCTQYDVKINFERLSGSELNCAVDDISLAFLPQPPGVSADAITAYVVTGYPTEAVSAEKITAYVVTGFPTDAVSAEKITAYVIVEETP